MDFSLVSSSKYPVPIETTSSMGTPGYSTWCKGGGERGGEVGWRGWGAGGLKEVIEVEGQRVLWGHWGTAPGSRGVWRRGGERGGG